MTKNRIYFKRFLIFIALATSATCVLGAEASTQSSKNLDLSTDEAAVAGWTPLRFCPWNDTALPRKYNVTGLSIGGWDYAGRMTGLQIGLMEAEVEHLHGISIGVVGTETSGWGLAVASLFAEADTFSGIQIGGVGTNLWTTSECSTCESKVSGIQIGGLGNASTATKGVQLGIVANEAKQLKGIQLSALNRSEHAIGGQFGVWNEARELHGFQIGLYNDCETLVGFQLGVLNRVRKPHLFPVQFVPALNVSW